MYRKSKLLVATVTHTTLYAFASDVARSCKTTISYDGNYAVRGFPSPSYKALETTDGVAVDSHSNTASDI